MTAAIADLLSVVARRYGVTTAELRGHRRTKQVAWARQVAYWLLREQFEMSCSQVARLFERDHTSVLHAWSKLDRLRATDTTAAHDLTGALVAAARVAPSKRQRDLAGAVARNPELARRYGLEVAS